MQSSTAYLVLDQEVINILQQKGRIPGSKGGVISPPVLARARKTYDRHRDQILTPPRLSGSGSINGRVVCQKKEKKEEEKGKQTEERRVMYITHLRPQKRLSLLPRSR